MNIHMHIHTYTSILYVDLGHAYIHTYMHTYIHTWLLEWVVEGRESGWNNLFHNFWYSRMTLHIAPAVIRLCMYVCMCMYVCIYGMYVCTYVRMYICFIKSTLTSESKSALTNIPFVCMYVICMYEWMNVCMYVCTQYLNKFSKSFCFWQRVELVEPHCLWCP